MKQEQTQHGGSSNLKSYYKSEVLYFHMGFPTLRFAQMFYTE